MCRNVSAKGHGFILADGPAVAILVLGLAMWTTSLAAVAQEIPGSVSPGQIEKRFDTQPKIRERPKPEIERPEAPTAAPKYISTFTLSGVEIEGATVYGAAEFAPLYRDLIGKEVQLSDLVPIAKKIGERYQQDGYVLSRAIVPDQTPENGIVTIRVIEGYIEQVAVEGQVKGDADLLVAYGDKITADRPTRIENLERYVLLISDLPGVTLHPLLEPVDAAKGRYKLILSMEHRSIAGSLQADNRGSNFIGPYELWAGAGFNSIFGLYESSRLRFITTPDAHDLVFFDGAYSEPIDSEGTIINAIGSYAATSPGHTLEQFDIHSWSAQGGVQVTHPFIRSRHLDVYGEARFTYLNSASNSQGIRIFEDRLRVLRGGTIVSFDDGANGRDWFSGELSQGLDILGASKPDAPNVSRPGADTNFTKFAVDFSRYQRFEEAWGFLVLATGQIATGRLLSPEEIGLGGERFGRAYDAAEITGQDGIAGRVELQHDFWPQNFPLTQIQLYTFYDIGAVRNTRLQSLSSVGGGVRVQLIYGIFAYLEVAKPLTRSVLGEGTEGKQPRLFFTVRSDF